MTVTTGSGTYLRNREERNKKFSLHVRMTVHLL